MGHIPEMVLLLSPQSWVDRKVGMERVDLGGMEEDEYDLNVALAHSLQPRLHLHSPTLAHSARLQWVSETMKKESTSLNIVSFLSSIPVPTGPHCQVLSSWVTIAAASVR